ncbi:hypothetical protein [Williamsia sp. CHRR-6]|uniref:hypothetical protein n=1 Tax=Williamsia sp. CHRR-6 TaxID=2835871 RepID=UPI001BDA5E37|nr:hypothetical protein [Williamsia sp. CHRR-6]MBT0565252.1 hypothetical protein [Williamsia sp. CHRR-6]
MLVSALAATLIGFALLVVALVTGTLWLAVACIVVCVVGGLLLLADTLGLSSALTRSAAPYVTRTRNAVHTARSGRRRRRTAQPASQDPSAAELTAPIPVVSDPPTPEPEVSGSQIGSHDDSGGEGSPAAPDMARSSRAPEPVSSPPEPTEVSASESASETTAEIPRIVEVPSVEGRGADSRARHRADGSSS